MKVGRMSAVGTLMIVAVLLALVMACGTPGWAQTRKNPGPTAAFAGAQPWAPPEVEAAEADSDCSAQRVLPLARERVKEFVTNLPQFTATERLEHQQLGKGGAWGAPEVRTFEYMAEMREVYPGILSSEEYRDGSRSLEVFPAGLADLGLPALVLVFHPYFLDDHSIVCEGLREWHGQAAWQFYFQQRPDRPVRLQGFNSKIGWFPLKLKGRAWIAADSYQVLHLETDLLYPVPQIRLLREHVAVDYRPVPFPKHKVELWLPETAEVYMDFHGHRYRRRHTFSNFLLFAVDVKQKIAEPKAPE